MGDPNNMIIKIKMSKQNGDKRVNLYSLFLGIILMALLITLCVTTTFFLWFIEGTELLLLVLWIGIPLTFISWFIIKRSYYKISFNDENVRLHSLFPFVSRNIEYLDIIKVFIDNTSNKRRIETKNEFFEINNADVATLRLICNQKLLKMTMHNVV